MSSICCFLCLFFPEHVVLIVAFIPSSSSISYMHVFTKAFDLKHHGKELCTSKSWIILCFLLSYLQSISLSRMHPSCLFPPTEPIPSGMSMAVSPANKAQSLTDACAQQFFAHFKCPLHSLLLATEPWSKEAVSHRL